MKAQNSLTRRDLLRRACWLTLGAVLAALPTHPLGEDLAAQDASYADSMGSMMEGAIKASAAKSLKLDFHGRAQGSNALAQLIVGGSIRSDVFIPVTPGPALTVLKAGKGDSAQPVAKTEMVLAYGPKSRLASRFEAAAKGKE